MAQLQDNWKESAEIRRKPTGFEKIQTESRRESKLADQKIDKRLDQITVNTDKVSQCIKQNGEFLTRQSKEQAKGFTELKKSSKQVLESVRRQIEGFDKVHGDLNNKWRRFLEDLVRRGLCDILKERGTEVYEINPRTIFCAKSKTTRAEYDLVAVGTKKIIVVEDKSTLTRAEVSAFLKKYLTSKTIAKFTKTLPFTER